MIDWLTIGGGLLKATLPTVAKAIIKKINSQLNPAELEMAIKEGIEAAQEEEKKRLEQGLFHRCEEKQIGTFLAKVFESSGVQEELEKPLRNQEAPDKRHLIETFKQAANKLNIKLNEVGLEPWVTKFTQIYFEKTSAYLRCKIAKEEYCKQLVYWFDDIKLAGIAVEGKEVEKSIKSTQIFVMPDVIEDAQTSENKLDAEKDIELTDEVANINKRQAELIRQQRQIIRLENISSRKFLAKQLLSESKSNKLVLLGAPGSGKTTLMTYFTVMIADKKTQNLGLTADKNLLPILIKIRDLARHGELSILEYIKQFAHKNLGIKQIPTGFFEYWLENGKALILLDGLDEVADTAHRYEIVNQIEVFLSQFSRNWAIITSRPAGYRRDFFRTEDFPHYQLQPFDDTKIEEFINRWYDSRIQDLEEAQRRKDSLRKALADNDRIKLLAKNPLLLTIIALIHRYQASLPRERYKLYEKAVETLLTSWDANKEFSNRLVFQYLELDDLKRLLESLACWIHTQESTGDKEGGTLIDRDELIEQLSKDIKTLKQVKLYEAQAEAKRFVEFIRDRTGLLNEQGQDCYAFVHKTFQEYLCAQEIIYQLQNENDFNIVINYIKDHLHDPHWREVLLLLIAQQKPKPAAKAIRAILDQHSEYEQWLHRDLFFAASCLAENPKGLKTAETSLPEEILQALVALEVSDSLQVTDKIRSQVFQTLCSLNETAFQAQALQLLKNKAAQIDKVKFQEYRASLGEREEAINTLLALLEDKSSSVRANAAEALGKIGSEAAISSLIKLIEDPGSSVRARAAYALGQIGSEEAIPSLIKLIEDPEIDVGYLSALGLGKIGSEAAISGLIKLIEHSESDVRYSAVEGLAKIGSEAVIPGLIKLIEHSESDVRYSAIEGLAKIGLEAAIPHLIKVIQEDPEIDVRAHAAQALGQIGSQAAIPGLLKLIEDPEANVRSCAALALGQIGSKTAIPGLLKLIEDSKSFVRSRAADALGQLGSEATIAGLLKLIKDPKYSVRARAALALGQIGSQAAIPGLLKLIEDPEAKVRSCAALALGQIGSKTAIPGLLKLIETQTTNLTGMKMLCKGFIANLMNW
ncbi:hypothetical protein NUACC21_20200 [Scytonema sp. NUACC21]